jgi:DNA-binding IclR family transcriptional regulator
MEMPAMSGDRPAYPIESVDRALQLLTLLGSDRTVTVSGAAESLNVARSTAHRLLAMLQYRGFVRQDPETKVYSAGGAILQIGLSAVDSLDFRAVARPHMEALRATFDETVHLALLDGETVLFLDSLESTRTLRVGSRRGFSMPAYCTAAGKALLAQLAPDQLDAHLPARLDGLTDRSLRRHDELRRVLDAVRESGYATNFGESEDDVSAVAVGIQATTTGNHVAITLTTPSSRMTAERVPEFAAAIRSHTEAIAASLNRADAGAP